MVYRPLCRAWVNQRTLLYLLPASGLRCRVFETMVGGQRCHLGAAHAGPRGGLEMAVRQCATHQYVAHQNVAHLNATHQICYLAQTRGTPKFHMSHARITLAKKSHLETPHAEMSRTCQNFARKLKMPLSPTCRPLTCHTPIVSRQSVLTRNFSDENSAHKMPCTRTVSHSKMSATKRPCT